MRLSLILPTLDERDNVAVLVPAISSLPFVREVLVVDDGSVDGTRELVREISRNDRRVRLIARDTNPGLTRALQAGIAAADGELIGWMDADRSMKPDDLLRLVSALDAGADIAIGSRFALGGTIKGQTRAGRFGRLQALVTLPRSESRLASALSWGLNALILPALLGGPARDYTSGFIVGRRSFITAHPLRGEHGEYFMTLWIGAECDGARLVEVPCHLDARVSGVTKTAPSLSVLLSRGLEYLRAAWSLRGSSIRSRRR